MVKWKWEDCSKSQKRRLAVSMSASPKKPKQSEHHSQVQLMKWSSTMFNNYPELKWLFAIPNGGARDIRVAVKLKAEGVKPGVWDLFLPVARDGYHGMFIEMKFGKNKLTITQKEFRAFIKDQNYYGVVAYSWNEAADAIEKYLK